MNTRAGFRWVCVGLSLLMLSGCDLPIATVWRDDEQLLEIPLDELKSVSVETHNGSISAAPAPQAVVAVRAKIRAGGNSPQDAEACLEALEVVAESPQPDQLQVTWRWNVPRRPSWQAHVSFEVALPAQLNLLAKSHNGKLQVNQIQGDCDLETHNGEIRVDNAANSRLHAATHNGPLEIVTSANEIDLQTHNGAVQAHLSSQTPRGSIQTHNGGIELSLSQQSAVRLECQTVNGSIANRLDLQDLQTKKRQRLSGTLGQGTHTLEVETHNGGISLSDSPTAEAQEL
jgi:hypothetical protein